MNIFITGSRGFLGYHLKRKLSSNKDNYLITPNKEECNLATFGSLEKYNEHYDIIFHLAAWTQAGDFCLKYPGDQWIINQKINTNVLEWWKNKHRNSLLVIIGTSCVYTPDEDHIELNYSNSIPTESLETYAFTKKMLYQGVKAINKQYKSEYLCFVPSTLFGTHYHNDERQSHFIFDLIKKILRGHFNNEEVRLWGDGNQIREIIEVNDFIENMIKVIDKKYKNEIFNIGSNQPKKIRDFAKYICEYIGYDEKRIIYDETKYVGAISKFLNTEKISNSIDFNVKDNFEDLKRVIDWHIKNKQY